MTQLLEKRSGVKVCSMTVRWVLYEAGIVRIKPTRRGVPSGQSKGSPKRYGYTELHRQQHTGRDYSCCLTDAEWALVADLFEHMATGRGMPPQLERRTLLNACCYVLRTGCAWQLLPKSFPPWTTIYKSFSRWAAQGAFEAMLHRLRQQWRERLGRHAQPSAAVLDSQSTRNSPQGGEAGFDGAKKVKGRKRHMLVDTLGLLLAVTVSAARVQDRDGATDVVAQAFARVLTLRFSLHLLSSTLAISAL
ncbi:IS5 family transposase [Azohydromonas australica]|uniref:IS5 family transposase n=1 Tax=Azohydromonas australica TaxID=364039 RepID=UPI0004120A65